MDSGDHAKAEVEFHRIVESSSEHLRARVHLGEICAAQGRADEAIRHYQAALELAPLDREIRVSLMKLGGSASFAPPLSTQQTQGMPGPSHAVPVADRIGAKEDLPATETLADLYVSQGLTERAADIYRQLLAEKPSREGIRIKLAALQETRHETAGPPCVSPDVAAIPPPTWGVSEPGFAAEGLPVFELSEEFGAVAAAPSFRVSHRQMLLHELERWLQGVRQYRRLPAGQ